MDYYMLERKSKIINDKLFNNCIIGNGGNGNGINMEGLVTGSNGVSLSFMFLRYIITQEAKYKHRKCKP